MFSLKYSRLRVVSSGVKIICHGNSHTAGEGASTTAFRWTSVMQNLFPLLSSGVTVVNTGIGGQSITAMIGNASTAVDAHLESGKVNILFAQEFGNELAANGRDVNAAWLKWVQYCNARRAAAAAASKKLYIITVGMHPAGAAATQALRDARVLGNMQVNELLRKRFRECSDQFIDVGAAEPFKSLYDSGVWTPEAFLALPGSPYDRSDATADDLVHLGNTGHAILASLAARAIMRIPRL